MAGTAREGEAQSRSPYTREHDAFSGLFIGRVDQPSTYEIIEEIVNPNRSWRPKDPFREVVVWRGRHHVADGYTPPVVIKAHPPATTPEEFSAWRVFADLLISLKGHENRIRIVDAFPAEAPHEKTTGSTGTTAPLLPNEAGNALCWYVIMEDAGELTLDGWISRNPHVDVKRKLELLRGPATAIDDLHAGLRPGPAANASLSQVGIVHADIKPQNIMVTHEPERLVLVDFGLSRTTNGIGQRELGYTPTYTPPDWLESGPTISTDRFAYYVVTAQMIAGIQPRVAPGPHGNRFTDIDEFALRVVQSPALAAYPKLAAALAIAIKDKPTARTKPLVLWHEHLSACAERDISAQLAAERRVQDRAAAITETQRREVAARRARRAAAARRTAARGLRRLTAVAVLAALLVGSVKAWDTGPIRDFRAGTSRAWDDFVANDPPASDENSVPPSDQTEPKKRKKSANPTATPSDKPESASPTNANTETSGPTAKPPPKVISAWMTEELFQAAGEHGAAPVQEASSSYKTALGGREHAHSYTWKVSLCHEESDGPTGWSDFPLAGRWDTMTFLLGLWDGSWEQSDATVRVLDAVTRRTLLRTDLSVSTAPRDVRLNVAGVNRLRLEVTDHRATDHEGCGFSDELVTRVVFAGVKLRRTS